MRTALNEEYMVISRHIIFTENELNNVVFLCLKYTFGKEIPELKDPLNQDIKTLIFELHEDPTPANIIDRIIEFVVGKFGSDRISDRKSGYKRHMQATIDEFLNQPYDLRNDLGDDSNSEDLITRH